MRPEKYRDKAHSQVDSQVQHDRTIELIKRLQADPEYRKEVLDRIGSPGISR